MPKRSSKPPDDPNEAAHDAVRRLTGKDEDQTASDPDEQARREAARILGSLGGKKGGPARAEKLSPRRRKQIAKKAALARWKKKRR